MGEILFKTFYHHNYIAKQIEKIIKSTMTHEIEINLKKKTLLKMAQGDSILSFSLINNYTLVDIFLLFLTFVADRSYQYCCHN